jgi:hypothetical protein
MLTAIIKKNKKRLMRGYLKKVMTFRGEMKEQPPAEKCGKQWAKLYSKYGKYARDMKKWYTSQIQFLSTQRRKFKKCTKKFTQCGAYKFKTKQINKYRTRFAALQKVFRARLEKWGTECKVNLFQSYLNFYYLVNFNAESKDIFSGEPSRQENTTGRRTRRGSSRATKGFRSVQGAG